MNINDNQYYYNPYYLPSKISSNNNLDRRK